MGRPLVVQGGSASACIEWPKTPTMASPGRVAPRQGTPSGARLPPVRWTGTGCQLGWSVASLRRAHAIVCLIPRVHDAGRSCPARNGVMATGSDLEKSCRAETRLQLGPRSLRTAAPTWMYFLPAGVNLRCGWCQHPHRLLSSESPGCRGGQIRALQKAEMFDKGCLVLESIPGRLPGKL